MKNSLTISKQEAITLYPDAPEALKKKLIAAFGKNTFIPPNMMEKVKTVADACEVLGPAHKHVKALSILEKATAPEHIIAHQQLVVIVCALNAGWEPDWTNTNEYKWWPWFRFSGSAFVFYDSGYAFDLTSTSVGSRLCYKEKELATYAGKQFIKVYNKFLN
jgi:hypothetical protein